MKLILQSKDDSDQIYLLGEKNIIGRGKDSIVPLSNDDQASREHAVIVKKGNQFWVKDLESSNGTYLNGEKIRKDMRILKNQDQITVGNSVLIVQDDDPVQMEMDFDDEATVFGDGPQPKGNVAGQAETDDLNEETQFLSTSEIQNLFDVNCVILHIVGGGPRQGETYALQKADTYIGRSSNNDLCLVSNAISSRHALISQRDQVYTITDLGSKNGTFVNKKRVADELALNPGDIIGIGDVSLRFGDEKTASTKSEDAAKSKTAWVFISVIMLAVIAGSVAYLMKPKKAGDGADGVVAIREVQEKNIDKKNVDSSRSNTASSPAKEAKQKNISKEELQKKAQRLIAEARQSYVDGSVDSAIQKLRNVDSLDLEKGDPIKVKGRDVLGKILQCQRLFNEGQQNYLNGQLDASVQQWNQIIALEVSFLDSLSSQKSYYSKKISRVMAEELYLQALNLVEQNNILMAKQYCVEVLKAIENHQGCIEILK